MTDLAYIFDTETTGFVEPQVIQAAAVPVRLDDLRQGPIREQSYKPSKAIELGALATHHILASELEGCPPSSSFSFPEFMPGCVYLVGHNIDYDWEVVGRPSVKRICTLAMARAFWPDLDTHSQTALMYHTYGDAARLRTRNAHSALQDVANLGELFIDLFLPELHKRLPAGLSWEDVWKLSEDCRIPKIMTFGKYKGRPVAEVDAGYRAWYRRQEDPDPYVLKAFDQVGRR